MSSCPNCFQAQPSLDAPCSWCGYHYEQEYFYALPPDTELEQGHYLVGRVLGQGGFGITYLCWDTRLKIKVAIKEFFPNQDSLATRNPKSGTVLPSKKADKAHIFSQFKTNFEREAQILASLNHPNLIRVMNIFEDRGTAYFVMEYLEGETLESYLAHKLPMGFAEMQSYLLPICEAVSALHATGLIHRDLKPANIYRKVDGLLVILDFGSARDYDSNMSMTAIASAGYAPYEQYARNQEQGPWTDIYALGAMSYYLLTGSLPPIATDRVMEDSITFPSGLSTIQTDWLQHALGVRPKDRPQSVEGWLNQLKNDAEKPVSQGSSHEQLFIQGVILPKLADKLLTSAEEAEIKSAALAFGLSEEQVRVLMERLLAETGSKRGEAAASPKIAIRPLPPELEVLQSHKPEIKAFSEQIFVSKEQPKTAKSTPQLQMPLNVSQSLQKTNDYVSKISTKHVKASQKTKDASNYFDDEFSDKLEAFHIISHENIFLFLAFIIPILSALWAARELSMLDFQNPSVFRLSDEYKSQKEFIPSFYLSAPSSAIISFYASYIFVNDLGSDRPNEGLLSKLFASIFFGILPFFFYAIFWSICVLVSILCFKVLLNISEPYYLFVSGLFLGLFQLCLANIFIKNRMNI